MNTNELYQRNVRNGNSGYPDNYLSSKSIMNKSGSNTRFMTIAEAKKIINNTGLEKQATIKGVVRFKTEKEGLRLANSFKRLARNPLVKLEITFEKIQDENND